LRLFTRGPAEPGKLDPQARYLLGSIAYARNEPGLAVELWHDIGPPPSVNADVWQLTLAHAALRAGNADGAAAAMESLLRRRSALSGELMQRSFELAQEMLELRQLDYAQRAYELLLGASTDTRAREVLNALGRVHELKGEHATAAGYYLRSALSGDTRTADTLAVQARLAAAMSLVRAGLRKDARAQFEWLARNAKDAAVSEAARRELQKL
jgi:hypothetical protein